MTDYATPEYLCGGCRARGVKLWRLPHDAGNLLCGPCCQREQDCMDKVLLPDGRHYDGTGRATDQLGNRLPAVPAPDGTTFWGYTSVPDEAKAWWNGLPLLAPGYEQGRQDAFAMVIRRIRTWGKTDGLDREALAIYLEGMAAG